MGEVGKLLRSYARKYMSKVRRQENLMDGIEDMAIIRLASPTWLKYVIALGTAFFLGLVVLSAFMIEESGVIFSAVAMTFFLYMTYRGAILCRYLNSEFELFDSTIRIKKGEATEQIPLAGVRFRFEDILQVFSVYNLAGDLVFAIDYMGQDIDRIKQATQDPDDMAL